MGNILPFRGITKVDLPADQILQAAIDAELDWAMVVGIDRDGTLYIAGTSSKTGDAVLALEAAKTELVKASFEP